MHQTVQFKKIIGIQFVCFFLVGGLFSVSPAAYGSSQARGQIRAIAASLHHRSQQRWILDPLSKARDRTLMDPGQVC